ncbi:MAG: dephospho-CoA kinase [Gemmataceae bacterium]|nr:dephospho-CoA kinase [Gemmataceae bacterium]
MIPVIGIIGGIGSGKSLVAQDMQRLGGHLIAADQLGHDALKQADILAKLVELWGGQILNKHGAADHQKLAAIVFADPHQLRSLEALVFSYIEQRIVEEIAQAQDWPDVRFIILDAAILIEAGWHRHCDKFVFVEAPRKQRLARVKKNRGWDEAELDRREATQMPLDEKRNLADAVIVNDEKPDKVARQVQSLLLQWQVI